MNVPAALAPFRVRSFRFQWPADLATSWAFEMEILILGWYVLVETGSVLLLTLYGALLYVGTLIAPMVTGNAVVGVLGWKFGRRNRLAVMLLLLVFAIAFAALVPALATTHFAVTGTGSGPGL